MATRKRANQAGDQPSAEWYDYPHYYDLAFSDETEQEVRFLSAAFERFGDGRIKRVLEAGCGTGRVVFRLAQLGYQASGFDLSKNMLDYLRQRLTTANLSANVFEADMADFKVARPVDAVLNGFNTFRHMLTEEAALGHLQSVARALRSGGLFVLGLHVMPPDADDYCIERWRAVDGPAIVTTTLRVLEWNRRTRKERLRISMLIRRKSAKPTRIRTEMTLRTYRLSQLRSLLAKVPELELCESFDFWFEIDEPIPLSPKVSDIVLVMRKV